MKNVVRSLLVVVGLPTLIAIIYFGIIASDVYVSEARFSIRSSDGGASALGGLAAMFTTSTGSGSAQDTAVVKDYIYSADMLDNLGSRVDLRQHYENKDIDWLSRLDSDATREEMLEYLEKKIDVLRDSGSDVVTLKTKAFTPETAQRLAQEIISISEGLVNRLSARIEEDALSTAREEIDRASAKVTKVGLELSRFRTDNRSVNPAEESTALMGLLSGIEGRIVDVRTELNEKRAYMKESAPEIIALTNRLNALQKQRRIEKGRLIGDQTDDPELSELIDDYRPLVIQQELAQQQYASALTSLEVARAEASRKKQYLITFIEPSLPDQAIEPRRIRKILTVLVFSFLFYSIGGLMWSALRDHVGR